jgi:glycerol-3-phosphate dehydrogenase
MAREPLIRLKTYDPIDLPLSLVAEMELAVGSEVITEHNQILVRRTAGWENLTLPTCASLSDVVQALGQVRVWHAQRPR